VSESRSVEVRFFASLAERAGRSVEQVVVDPGSDVLALWQTLTRRFPALGELTYRPLVACDLVYADWDRELDDVKEVAFLPPVSGG
jgi:molybdopterin converting factor small subunit